MREMEAIRNLGQGRPWVGRGKRGGHESTAQCAGPAFAATCSIKQGCCPWGDGRQYSEHGSSTGNNNDVGNDDDENINNNNINNSND